MSNFAEAVLGMEGASLTLCTENVIGAQLLITVATVAIRVGRGA